jgi:hypothetical protein
VPDILKIAYKLLVNDRTKFAVLLIGITFAVFLMIQMTLRFSGILQRSSATVINLGSKMDPAVQTVANSIPMPDYVLDEVLSKVALRRRSFARRRSVHSSRLRTRCSLLVQANHQTGLVTYLDVISADAQYHQATINALEAAAARYQDTVALFAARRRVVEHQRGLGRTAVWKGSQWTPI